MEESSKLKGWGKGNYRYPAGWAYIECDEMKCTGCGICQMACSMKHFGVINKELSRIRVRKYLLPLPKAIQMTCVHCPDMERECEKACPLTPPAIYFDKKSLHMVIDQERCLGNTCLQCQEACSAKAIRGYPSVSSPFVCDLCDTENTGNRDPQCVNVCPCNAILYVETPSRFPNLLYQDTTRKHEDVKAESIAKRLYPMNKESVWQPKET